MQDNYYGFCSNKDFSSEALEKIGEDEYLNQDFFHCVVLAENAEQAKEIIRSHNIFVLTVRPINEYFEQNGYQHDIAHLSSHIHSQRPILISPPIAFFNSKEKQEQKQIDPNEAVDNGIMDIQISTGDEEDFLSKAKLWLLQQAGIHLKKEGLESSFEIEDQKEFDRTMILIDGAQFHPYLGLSSIKDKMVSLFQGRHGEEMEKVSPYLLDRQYLLDLMEDLHDAHFSAKLSDPPSLFTSFRELKGVMIIKTNASMDEVRHHLRRFTRVKTEDDQWVYFRFTEQLSLQEWLRCSEAETTSYFMQMMDEICFARADHCSFHRLIVNKDKMILDPKYPKLNGGFLLTKRQNNALKQGKKLETINEAEIFLYKHYGDILKARERTRDHVQSYLHRMWDNFHQAGGETKRGYIQSCMAGIYLGVDYMFDPCRKQFIHGELDLSYDDDIDWDDQTFFLSNLENFSDEIWLYQHNHQWLDHIVDQIITDAKEEKLNIRKIYNIFINQHIVASQTINEERFIRFIERSPFDQTQNFSERVKDLIYALSKGCGYKTDPLIGG